MYRSSETYVQIDRCTPSLIRFAALSTFPPGEGFGRCRAIEFYITLPF